MTIARTQNLNGLKKASKNVSFAPYFMYYNQKRRRRCKWVKLKSTGDRLGQWEKAKVRGTSGTGLKSKMIDTYFFYIGGYRIINSQRLT